MAVIKAVMKCVPYQTASRGGVEVEKWSWFRGFIAWKVHRVWEELESLD